jgi:hypothetical protein
MFVVGFRVAGDEKTWIGYLSSFWGTVIGGVISGVIILMVLELQLITMKEKRNEEFPKRCFVLELLTFSVFAY